MRAIWLLLVGVAMSACKPAGFAAGAPSVYFPDQDPTTGTIPYRGGGTFLVGIKTTLPSLRTPTHAQLSFVSADAASNQAAQTVALTDQGDGGVLAGVTTLTWPPGGDVQLYVQVAGEALSPSPVAPLTRPAVVFHNTGSSFTGTQWQYTYCLEATMDDGMVAIHADQATLQNGMADATVSLAQGPCVDVTPERPDTRSHATVTFLTSPGAGSFHATATYAPAQLVAPLDVPLQAVGITLSFSSPDVTITDSTQVVSVPPLHVVRLDITASTASGPASGISVSIHATPAVQATIPFPSTVTTAADGVAETFFQVPQTGQVRIDATVGSAEKGLTFVATGG